LAVVALCVQAALGYVSAVGWIQHTLEVEHELDEWTISMLEVETNVRGFLGSENPVFLSRADAAVEAASAHARSLRRLVADNADQSRKVALAQSEATATVEHLREKLARVEAGRRNEALADLADGKGKRLADVFRKRIEALRAAEAALLVQRRDQANSRAVMALLGAVLLAFASGALLVFAWRRERRHERAVSALARAARERLELLSELAAALGAARTTEQVAEVVVQYGMRTAHGDTCTLYVLDESGTVLDLVGHQGVAPEVLEAVRRMSQTQHPQSLAAVKAGESLWVETPAQYATLFPQLAGMKVPARRANAFWSVPLQAEGRPLGLLGVGFYQPRTFSADERRFVHTLANQCAQALLRAGRLKREDEAQRWFKTTLRSIGDAVIATDAEGRVSFMNGVAESLTEWSEADATGEDLEKVFPIFSEDTGQVVESPVKKVLREGTVVGLANHTILRARGGREIPIDDSGAPILDDGGAIIGVVLVFRDATDEKRTKVRTAFLAKAGEALVSSLDYQATLATVARLAVPQLADWCAVELLPPGGSDPEQVAVAHIDPGKVEFARKLGERYPRDRDATTGVPAVVRTGRSELYPEIPKALLEAAAKDAEHLRLIRELQLESAMIVPLRARDRTFGAMSFIYAESRRRYSASDLAFAEDFARRAAMAIENALAIKGADEAQERERILRGEAERANRSKDEFLATVSHELRTPLNAILGWTVTLRRRSPPEDMDRGLAVIERNARAQAKLIEDVLDMSRIISGKLSLNLRPTNVGALMKAAVETVTPAAEAKSIVISSNVPDDSLTITVDAARLQQVVWNLLSNAVKFTPKGGQISLDVYKEGSLVYVCVGDTGEGIRSEVLPLVFEPFHQADASTTRRHGGLGLGLSIVKQIVSAHGGTVRASSDGAAKGSQFIIELPARSATPAVAESTLDAAGVELGAASMDAPRLDGLRVLVVDDEHDARALVREVLADQGAEVHIAGSAGEALEKLDSLRPDVIVSDIGMPGEDGYSFMRKVRARAPYQGGRTPAVALTAYARQQDVQLALAAGFQTHVTKPVEPAKLAGVVAELGGRRSRRP
ncbi:MAG TPA: ATP-binding protein, partial [Polyangiaceae bacterium]|nr:ATP-binding protein [Polyangiaceae bacterium]